MYVISKFNSEYIYLDKSMKDPKNKLTEDSLFEDKIFKWTDSLNNAITFKTILDAVVFWNSYNKTGYIDIIEEENEQKYYIDKFHKGKEKCIRPEVLELILNKPNQCIINDTFGLKKIFQYSTIIV